jgi:phosphinothricin acetyltransferase
MVERFEVRPAVAADLEALNGVYNHYVRHSHVTFDIDPIPMTARREWFTHYGTSGPHRVLVAATANQFLGYATSSPYHDRAGYRPSVQTSIYTAPGLGGHGIGSALYDALLPLLDAEDVHRAYGGIALPNPASVALHERCGFTPVGCFTEQGRKFDRYWDVAWYERPVP